MNLIDAIVSLIIFTILAWLLAHIVILNNRSANLLEEKTKVINLQDNFFSTLQNQRNTIEVDRQKENFQKEVKAQFLNSFHWEKLTLTPTDMDEGTYSCYNISLTGGKIKLEKKLTSLEIADTEIMTNYLWDLGDDVTNISCFYNTHNYIWDSTWINPQLSPISFVIYSFFQDNSFNQNYLYRKWIIYFN